MQTGGGLTDGAEWELGFIDHHWSQAIRTLDFVHAAEHLGAIGASLYGENTVKPHVWLDGHLHQLKHTGPDEIWLK
jgi:hypothetical protein